MHAHKYIQDINMRGKSMQILWFVGSGHRNYKL